MGRLPFCEIDLLVMDRMGKDISGAGMDTNVIGRGVHGYSWALNGSAPVAHRIFVRELAPTSHANAVGIGLADFTTSRLVREIDPEKTYINPLTAVVVHLAKIPIHLLMDRPVGSVEGGQVIRKHE